MPLTEQQLSERNQYIGASDIPIIMGFSTFMNPYDLWLQKTGRLVENGKASRAAEAGIELEPLILNRASQELGRIKKSTAKGQALEFRITIEGVLYVVHPDGIALEKQSRPVEAKSSGILYPTAEHWGEPGSDDIPDRVILQSHGQMMATGKDICYVPVVLTGMKFSIYEIPFRQEIRDAIVESCCGFKRNHIDKDIPPENVLPSMDFARRIRRQPNRTVSIPASLISAYEEAKEFAKEADYRKTQAQNAILAALDGADGAIADDGRKLTNLTYTRTGIDTDRLKKEKPEIAAKYKKITEYQSFRFPKK